MCRFTRFSLALTFLLIVILPSIFADNDINRKAFNFSGTGTRALGMGGAFIAVGGDPASGYWNPAGLAEIRDSQIMVSYNVYGQNTELINQFNSESFNLSGYDLTLDINNIDFISLTLPFKQDDFFMVHQISFSRVKNYKFNGSLASQYTYEDSDYFELGDYSVDSSGAMNAISYSVGFVVADWINVGATYNHYLGSFTSNETFSYTYTALDDSSTSVETSLLVNDWEFLGDNFIIGIILKPFDFLRIGATYHTNFDLKINYNDSLDYTLTVDGLDAVQRLSSSSEATIKYPAMIGVGIALFPMENLTLACDYSFSDWEADLNEDDEYIRGTISGYNFPYHPDDPPYSSDDYNFPTFTDPEAYTQQQESFLRIGAEYMFDFKDFDIYLRGGYWLHRSIFLDSNLEPVDFTGITAGVGLNLAFLKLELAWVNTSGEYTMFMDIAGGPETEDKTNLLFAQISYIFESF